MPLADTDYLFTGNSSCPVTFAFAYTATLDPDALRAGLRELEQHIPWLAGKLRARGADSFVFEHDHHMHSPFEVVRSPHTWHELVSGEPVVKLVQAIDGEPLYPCGSRNAAGIDRRHQHVARVGRWLQLVPQTRIALRAGHLDVLMDEAQRGVSARLSKNDVLTAWLWRTYGRQWWSAEDHERVYMTCPVDVRRLLDRRHGRGAARR
jgi:hypothetical protein